MGMLWSGARVQPLPFMLLPCLAEAYPRGGPSGFAAANALHRAWSWSNLQPSFLQVPLYATPWHGGALASIFFFFAGGPPPALLVLPPGVRCTAATRVYSQNAHPPTPGRLSGDHHGGPSLASGYGRDSDRGHGHGHGRGCGHGRARNPSMSDGHGLGHNGASASPAR